jgi:hypothetical protein
MSEYPDKIAQMAVWKRTLSEEEILTLTNGVNKDSQALLDEAHRLWSRMHDVMRLSPEMLGIPNRRRAAVMATRKKHE